jgi:teichuronic acid biosynthesis glycosyltransferase TuaC
VALRVLQLTNMYPSAEQPNRGVFVRSQVESLARHGVSSEVEEIQGYLSTLNYLRALPALPARVHAGRYDLVHMHFGYTALAAVAVSGRPSVLSFCGDDLLGRPDEQGTRSRKSMALVGLGKRAARRADAIIVKSDEMKQALGPGYADVEVIPNGLDLDFFEPLPREQARSALGWPQDAEILFFPADAAEPRKNFALAQAVCARLRGAGRPVRLERMFGRPQSNIVLAMAAADVLLSCAVQEGSPNAVKEGMAMNLPIVASDVGDCAQRLELCSPGAVVTLDVDAFAAATEKILQTGGGRSNGREHISELGLDAVARRVVAVYRRSIVRFDARRRR